MSDTNQKVTIDLGRLKDDLRDFLADDPEREGILSDPDTEPQGFIHECVCRVLMDTPIYLEMREAAAGFLEKRSAEDRTAVPELGVGM